jgi:hypothetical protein
MKPRLYPPPLSSAIASVDFHIYGTNNAVSKSLPRCLDKFLIQSMFSHCHHCTCGLLLLSLSSYILQCYFSVYLLACHTATSQSIFSFAVLLLLSPSSYMPYYYFSVPRLTCVLLLVSPSSYVPRTQTPTRNPSMLLRGTLWASHARLKSKPRPSYDI